MHHLTKGGEDYGSVWLTAGAGSVLRLSGKAGGERARLTQAKAPAHFVGPLHLVQDRDNGEIELRSEARLGDGREPSTGDAATGKTDLTEWVSSRGGATAADLEGLGEEVRRRVFAASGVTLEWEIHRIGVPSPYPPGHETRQPLPRAGELT